MKKILSLLLLCGALSTVLAQTTMIIDWGDNTNGQLFPPFQKRNASLLSAGYTHSLYVDNGLIYAIGNNSDSQLDTPPGNFIAISSGLKHSLAINSDSMVLAWGLNEHQQTEIPVGLNQVVMVGAGDEHSIALTSSGNVIAWGGGTFGQDTVPQSIQADSMVQISAGNFHNLVIDKSGKVFGWGRNDYGQTNVPNIPDSVIAVSAGELHSVALTHTGIVHAWGDNKFFKQLEVPVEAQGHIVAIDAGTHHTIALLDDNSIIAWGNNTFLQSDIPDILIERDVYNISAGYSGNMLVASNFVPEEVVTDTVYLFEEAEYDQYGELLISDMDSVESFRTELISGEGDEDNEAFERSLFFYSPFSVPEYANDASWREAFYSSEGGTFKSFYVHHGTGVLDFEAKSSYEIRTRSTDIGGESIEKAIVIQVLNINEEPISISLDSSSIAEGLAVGTKVGTFSAQDTDLGDSIRFLFGPSGPNNQDFEIDGNQLLTAREFNFNEQKNLVISVRAQDQGNLFIDSLFVIEVTDVNRPPEKIEINADEVYDDLAIGQSIGDFIVTDPDADDIHEITFSDTSAINSNHLFSIRGKTLVLEEELTSIREDKLIIFVTASDNGSPIKDLTSIIEINLLKSNAAPTNISLQSTEFSPTLEVGKIVSVITTEDANDEDIHTYELISGTGSEDNDYFSIADDHLLLNRNPDKENFNIRIKSTDNGIPRNLSIAKSFLLGIKPPADDLAPTEILLSKKTIGENNSLSDTIGSLSSVDLTPNDQHFYSVIKIQDGHFFDIKENRLVASKVFDFEKKNTYNVTIRTQDLSGNTFKQSFMINIENIMEPTNDIALSNNSISENAPIGTTVGTITPIGDEPSPITTIFVTDEGGKVSDKFIVDGDKLKTNFVPNHENNSVEKILISVQLEGASSINKLFEIKILDANDSISDVSISNDKLSEALLQGNTVAQFDAIDEDVFDTHRFELVAGVGDTDNASFSINANRLILGTSLDKDTQSSYSIRVKVSDQGNTEFHKIFEFLVVSESTDNIPPQSLSLSNFQINENTTNSSFIGVLTAVDPNEDDVIIYSFDNGQDDENFRIFKDSLYALIPFDYEQKDIYRIDVKAEDGNGGTIRKTLPISVVDVNESPIFISISDSVFSHPAGENTLIGVLSTIDPDQAQRHSYELLPSLDYENFRILNKNEVWSSVSINTKINRDYHINIRTRDDGNPAIDFDTEIKLSFKVTPRILSTEFTVEESQGSGTTVGQVLVESASPYTLEIVGGNIDGTFLLNDNSEQIVVAKDDAFNITEIASYSLILKVISEDGFESASSIIVKVRKGDRPQLLDGTFKIAENAEKGTLIGTVPFISENPDDVTFSLSQTTTDTNVTFEIDNQGNLSVGAGDLLNFEKETIYEVVVTVKSAQGFEDSKTYFIAVTNLNDIPNDISLSDSVTKGNQPIGTRIGILSTQDEDRGDSHTYEVIDNSNFGIEGQYLISKSTLDLTDTTEFKIIIKSTDNGSPNQFYSKEFIIKVEPLPQVLIYNLFTPNNDGFNDTWKIENIQFYQDKQISVLNGAGQVVYSSDTYSSGWNGRYKNEVLPSGAYYYNVVANGNVFKGTLTILTD